MTFEVQLPDKAYNLDKLFEELEGITENDGGRFDGAHTYAIMLDDATQADIDAVLQVASDHNAANQSLNQLLDAAGLDIDKAKRYLARVYNDPSPNVTDIYTQIKSYVDNNTILTQWVDHEMTMMSLVYGITFVIPPVSNLHRVQYIEAVKRVVSTFG